ncbi:MAG: aspartate--tRNA(Asn) ligase [Thaumarchaeota archaeon]|nr:aspartate--tRNA(Asn) ligase [Nitrososphaerota archaeon]
MEIKRTHYSSDLLSEEKGKRVSVAGWVEDVRMLGSLMFITLRDSRGVCQLVAKKQEVSPEVFDIIANTSRQSVIVAQGLLKESKAKNVPVEVQIQQFQVLSEAVHPLPLDPTGRIDTNPDKRLDARALDLRNPENLAIFKIRHAALQSVRKALIEHGFVEVSTSKIIGQAAEGGATLFSMDYFGKKGYLAQSPQLYKEQLTISLDRVFEIASFFRAEKSHTRRHLNEFVSVDIEAAFADEKDVMDILEDMVKTTIRDVKQSCPNELQLLNHDLRVPESIERVSYSQAVDELEKEGIGVKFGEDLSDQALGVLGKKHPSFYFLDEWPASLKPFYIARKEGTDLSRSFDLQHGALELASGGMRVSNRKELEERLKSAGLSLESFSTHLQVFDWGMPPHSGWGFGFDRFMMVLTGKSNIREVVLYPRDQFRLTP